MNIRIFTLLLIVIVFGNNALVKAQATYCPVEPMPELPGGGGSKAIVAAIQQRIAYPPKALQAGARGRVFIRFTITPSGQVREVVVIKPFRPDCDFAVVNAVRHLPRFKTRLKKYGNVRYLVPITFDIAGSKTALRPLRRTDYQQALLKAH